MKKHPRDLSPGDVFVGRGWHGDRIRLVVVENLGLDTGIAHTNKPYTLVLAPEVSARGPQSFRRSFLSSERVQVIGSKNIGIAS